MDIEQFVNHFFSVDDIAIFPIGMVINFPRWNSVLPKFNLSIDDDALIIVTRVVSDNVLSAQTFDFHVSAVLGVAVFNIRTLNIDALEAVDDKSRARMLDAVRSAVSDEMYVRLDIQSPTFDQDCEFLATYGFVEPVLSDGKVEMRFHRRISPKSVLATISALVNSTRTDRAVVTVVLPHSTVDALSKTVRFMNETAGSLSVQIRMDDGAIVLGLNSDNLVEGTTAEVNMPEIARPFVFHSHPDKATREYKLFISWPSGQDMKVVVNEYLRNRAQLAHLVTSPEGIWFIHMTPEFQSALHALKLQQGYVECALAVLEAIHHVFTTIEINRHSTFVEVLARHKAGLEYVRRANTYSIANLFADVPELATRCGLSHEAESEARLFNVMFAKWKEVESTGEIVRQFDYIPEPEAGLPFPIEPYA